MNTLNAPERLSEILSFQDSSRFLILFGPAVEDVFISRDYQQYSLEHALLQVLTQNGYSQVVFLSPHRPVYSLDSPSSYRHPAQPQRTIREAMNVSYSATPKLATGPFQNRVLFRHGSNPTPENNKTAMGDLQSLKLLDSMIRTTGEHPIAVVMLQAESTLRYFGDQRSLAGIIGEWMRLPSTNLNKCVLVFSTDRYESLCEIAHNLPVPELRSLILRRAASNHQKDSVIPISGPSSMEIMRLIRRFEQDRGLAVDRAEIARMSDWMASEGETLRTWISRLSQVDRLSIQVIQQKGWLSSTRNPARSAEDELASLVGLEKVKQRLIELSAWARLNLWRQHNNGASGGSLLAHSMFVGNPGTGKTSVARLLGELFHDIGFLRRGHLVEVTAADLIAEFVGGTAIKTNQVVDEALDGVLFIDEAYMLTEQDRGGYGQEALDTLLVRMENDRHRLVVIVAGYPERMRRFRDSNPGLARRIPEENIIEFPDYSPTELFNIFQHFLNERSLVLREDSIIPFQRLIERLYQRRDATFGNAGEIRNLVDTIERRYAQRIIATQSSDDRVVSIEDASENYLSLLSPLSVHAGDSLRKFDDLVGLDEVKDLLHKWLARLEYDHLRMEEDHAYLPETRGNHMLFLGNPGTGKTSVARRIGEILKDMSILRKGHLVEVARSDLVAGYVGQTAIKTSEKIREALDGILFIDEAYSLLRGGPEDFGMEAIDTLVKSMDQYSNRLVVIAAGYPSEMKQFIASNPGLASRFNHTLVFRDYTSRELLEILLNTAQKEGFLLSEEAVDAVRDYLETTALSLSSHHPNARQVLHILDQMKTALAVRIVRKIKENHPLKGEEIKIILAEDFSPPSEDVIETPIPIPPELIRNRPPLTRPDGG